RVQLRQAAIFSAHLGHALHPDTRMKNGALERIRTSDPQIRSLVLYPAELRVHLLGRHLAANARAATPKPHKFSNNLRSIGAKSRASACLRVNQPNSWPSSPRAIPVDLSLL